MNEAQSVTDSDERLIKRLVAGEESVLDLLMTRYQQSLYHFALRYTRNEQQALDIVQETFFRVYRRSESFNPKYSFKSWLYQIALNLCRDQARRAAVLRFVPFIDSREPSPNSSYSIVEEKSESEEEIAMLHRNIAELPHKLKSALILFALEEKSQIEAAEILGISQKSVETRVYRAKKMLRKKMKGS